MDYLRLKHALQIASLSLLLQVAGNCQSAPASAAPLLRCEVSYAGTTHTVDARPVADPYSVPAVDIGGRFLFKALMAGTPEKIEYIKLYAYLDAPRQPVLIQQVTYLPPFQQGPAASPLTGEQHLFAGPVERELMYQCKLLEIRP